MTREWIGWIATAAFAGSYLLKQPAALRRVQAGAALLWVAYGLSIHAMPVVFANLVVAGMAGYSSLPWRGLKSARMEGPMVDEWMWTDGGDREADAPAESDPPAEPYGAMEMGGAAG